MRKIAYIEIDTHPEIVSNFMDLMNDSSDFSVDYYLSEKIQRLISCQSRNLTTVSHENILEQLRDADYDLVIIGTVHRYFNVFNAIVDQFNTAIITHNLNFSTTSGFQLLKNIWKEDVAFRLKLWLKEGLLKSKSIYQKTNNLLVLDQGFTSTDYQYLPLFYSKKVDFKDFQELKVVIPGAVSQKRRDYQHILERIELFKSNIEFIFLGKASGEELSWLKASRKSLPQNVKIKFFTKKLSGADFEQEMLNASVLWCPVQTQTSFFSVPEFYGKTKMSGNIGDAVKYCKMAIFPCNYHSHFPFILKENIDIEEQLLEVSQQKIDFESFSKSKILKQLESVLDRII